MAAARPLRLTTTRLQALRATGRQRDISDPEKPGLVLRISPSGSKNWLFRYRWRGEAVRLAIGAYPARSLADARAAAQSCREFLERGIDPRTARRTYRTDTPATSKPDGHSVAHLAEEFMTRYIEPHQKRPEYVRRIIEAEVLKDWRARDARTIEPLEVIELLDGIVDRGSPVMANRTAAVLSQMFRFGLHRKLVASNPVQLLFRPGGPERGRERVLEDAELRLLFAKIDAVMIRAPRTAAAVRIMLLTACRRGELALARWVDLDLDGDAPSWRIPAENAKTGTEYLIPLVAQAVDEFRALKRLAGRSAYVLPADAGDGAMDAKLLTRSIARHMKAFGKVKLTPFTAHDIRRSVRTGLARLKIAPHIAERVLNHAQPGIVATYDRHAYLEEKRAALTAWAAHLDSLQ